MRTVDVEYPVRSNIEQSNFTAVITLSSIGINIHGANIKTRLRIKVRVFFPFNFAPILYVKLDLHLFSLLFNFALASGESQRIL